MVAGGAVEMRNVSAYVFQQPWGERTAVPNAIFPRKGTHGVAVETTGGIVIMAIIIAFHLVLWKAEM